MASNFWSNEAKYRLLFEFLKNAPLQWSLHDETVEPDPDLSYLSDYADSEITATGYTRKLLTGLSFTKSDADNLAYVTCDPPTFTDCGTPADPRGVSYAVLSIAIGGDADSPVVFVYDYGATAGGGDLEITIPPNGFGEIA